MSSTPFRSENLSLRVSVHEKDWLQSKTGDGRSVASVLRQLIRRGMEADGWETAIDLNAPADAQPTELTIPPPTNRPGYVSARGLKPPKKAS